MDDLVILSAYQPRSLLDAWAQGQTDVESSADLGRQTGCFWSTRVKVKGAICLIKYLGAAYLLYLGITTLLKKPEPKESIVVEPKPLWQIFRQGFVVNLFNPKTALFFLAFLPQFADPARGSVPLQTFLLGLIFVTIALVSDGVYALWRGAARHDEPIWHLLDQLQPVLHQQSVVALATPKGITVAHEIYDRYGRFRHGKRMITFLKRVQQ